MMEIKNIRRSFRLLRTRWLFTVNTFSVLGAVATFGLIATAFLGLNINNAELMLAVIPPMVIVTFINNAIVVNAINKRMGRLVEGIQTVAAGDLDVTLPLQDAAEYSEVYESFNLMVKELKTTKKEMETFTNELSHEFKTPITAIQGFAKYLLETDDGLETPERRKYLQIINDESQRLAAMAANTLLLSKVESCQIVTDQEWFDLGEQLRRCTILLLPQIEKKHISLEMDIPKISHYGNMEMLEQVWINLISNALKFTPDNGEISISARKDAASVSVCIADSGIGMDEDTRSHIFEKYYQQDTSHKTEGNGIGLSIVHRIVTLCQGRIEVTSVPGTGSAFTIILPAKDPSVQ